MNVPNLRYFCWGVNETEPGMEKLSLGEDFPLGIELSFVEVKSSPVGGLGLYALKDLNIGDVALTESPFLSVRSVPMHRREREGRF